MTRGLQSTPPDEEQAQLMKKLLHALPPDVQEQLEKGGEPGLTELTLRRWLAARNWAVADAARDLAAHAKWRAAYVPTGRISEEEVADQLAQEKVFLQGYDKQGRPFVILRSGRHVPGDLERCKRVIVYTMDAMADMAMLGRGEVKADAPLASLKGVGVIDMRGYGYKNMDPQNLKNIFLMLQDHYVECLGQCFIYEAPYFYDLVWRVVSPFLHPVTRAKVRFVTARDGPAVFADVFPLEALPADLGGTGEWRPVEETARRMRELRRAQEPKSAAAAV